MLIPGCGIMKIQLRTERMESRPSTSKYLKPLTHCIQRITGKYSCLIETSKRDVQLRYHRKEQERQVFLLCGSAISAGSNTPEVSSKA